MDERIRQEYQKIYSELYGIVLRLCAFSLIVKVAFFRQNFSQLWLEYIILVGSPIYRFIRCRMRGVVLPVENRKKQWGIRFAATLIAIVILDVLIMYFRFGKVDGREIFLFLFQFAIIFILAAGISLIVQKRWQKKMENQYRD